MNYLLFLKEPDMVPKELGQFETNYIPQKGEIIVFEKDNCEYEVQYVIRKIDKGKGECFSVIVSKYKFQ